MDYKKEYIKIMSEKDIKKLEDMEEKYFKIAEKRKEEGKEISSIAWLNINIMRRILQLRKIDSDYKESVMKELNR